MTIFLFAAALLPAAQAPADEVILSDGSRIVGQIVEQVAGKLVIKTQHAGDITIDAAAVTGFTSDRTLNIQLESGDRLTGTPAYSPQAGQTVASPALGQVAVPAQTKVTTVWEEGQPEPISAEEKARLAAIQEQLDKFKHPWSSRLQFGLTGSTGNNERLAFNGKIEAKREVEFERLYLSAEGYYAEENSDRNQNEILGQARVERDISDRFFLFGKAALEYDEFENLDLRTTLSAGVGYFVIKKPEHEWKLRAGIGYQHEAFDDGSSEDDVVLDLGYDYFIDINEWLRFTQSLTYYPSLEDFSDYRVMLETAGEVPLSPDEKWKLRAGMRNDYDAQPQPDIERLDTTYFFNIAYDF